MTTIVYGTLGITYPDTSTQISNKVPEVTVYTSGSGTYTTPANTQYLVIEMVGAGGGGGSSGAGGTGANGSTGGNTTLNSTLFVAGGGLGGASSSGASSQTGGAGGGTSGSADIQVPGQRGTARSFYGAISGGYAGGGVGGSSAFGASGGEGGRSDATSVVLGAGGGGGGFCRGLISSPAASYTYAVGLGGAGGSAGTNGFAGETGRNGLIIITAYFS